MRTRIACLLFCRTPSMVRASIPKRWKSPWFPVGTPVACFIAIVKRVVSDRL